VTYIEAHGTGTSLGDPVEINGLKSAFRDLYAATGESAVAGTHCGLGSVKTNIGHLELAAGIAGVIKVLLQMKHKTLVKSLHSESLNPYIELEGSPFYVVQEAREWTAVRDAQGRSLPRRAGVSSFGFGGVNAHVVLEEYVPSTVVSPVMNEPVVVVVSARNEERLREQVQQLLAFVSTPQAASEIVLDDLAYTLQVGREAMEERLGLVVGSLAELREILSAYVAGRAAIENLHRGQVRRNKDAVTALSANENMPHIVRNWIENSSLDKLLDVWVKGYGLDWSGLYGAHKPRRISLPTYPFARDRYGMSSGMAARSNAPTSSALSQVLHPLLHRNTSDLSVQRYTSHFHGEEFFLADHRVANIRVLPGVAQLEMVLAAAREATHRDSGLSLSKVMWARPIVVGATGLTLHLALHPQQGAAIHYDIYGDAEGEITSYGQGTIQVAPAEADVIASGVRHDLAALREQCSMGHLSSAQCYAVFDGKGMHYGPGFRGLNDVFVGHGQVLAQSSLPVSVASSLNHYLLHPSLLDAALQAPLGLQMAAIGTGDIALALPFALEALEVLAPCPSQIWAVVRYSAGTAAGDAVQKLDIDLCDPTGLVCVRFKQFSFRPFDPKPTRGTNIDRNTAAMADSIGVTPTSSRETRETTATAAQTALPVNDLLREKSTLQFKKLIGNSIKLPADAIEADVSFDEYGIDSFLVMELTNALGDVFGADNISTTLLFEYQSIESLVEYFMQTKAEALMRWTGLDAAVATLAPVIEAVADGIATAPHSLHAVAAMVNATTSAVTQPLNPVLTPRSTMPASPRFRVQESVPGVAPTRVDALVASRFDVAIIGLSGRYPGAADVNRFWDNLAAGRNCISEVPPERWEHSRFFDEKKAQSGKTYTRWAGLLDDVDCFDRLFFNITPHDAQQMSPQERLFLQEAYASIEDAGYTPENLCPSRKVGSFVGVVNEHYATGVRFWSIANRISYLFNFHGPSMAVDTACSSSLTAVHLAIESLRSGDSEVAIAGGVNLIVAPAHLIDLSSIMMLSSGDKCKPFAVDGDGFVDSEAVGAIVLKPIHRAVADGDHIYGVIKGSAVNSGGKTHGYMAPNPNMQAQLVSDALQRAGVDARSVSYMEAHGTGTLLGDPIEIAGLSKAFRHWTQDTQFCAIGSAKSNVGHSESASGFVGISKVLMQMKHQTLAPSLHAGTLNPKIRFADTPFVLQQKLAPWRRPILELDGQPQERPRIAGVSSFGAGGANAHVVIEEYISPLNANEVLTQASRGPAMIVLSARNDDRLKEQVQRLLAAIISTRIDVDLTLTNVAYTLQVGRDAMEERLALLVDSLDDLQFKLTAFAAGREDVEGVYRGHAKRKALSMLSGDEDMDMTIQAWVAKGKFGKLLDLWVKGFSFDWNVLYEKESGISHPSRISLPTYPFARESYWTDVAYPDPSSALATASPPQLFTHRDIAASPAAPVMAPSNEADATPATGAEQLPDSGSPSLPDASDIVMVAPALPSIALSDVEDSTSLTRHKQVMLTIWQELFGRPSVEIDDDFFELGGDSLLGMQLISRIRAEFGIEVEMSLIFEAPTLKSLIASIKLLDTTAGPTSEHETPSAIQPVTGGTLEQQLSYWKQQLAGSPGLLTLPTDRPRPPEQTQSGASLLYSIPVSLVSELQALGRQSQSTLFMTLCAAFNVLLARYSGQSDICIGTPIANRNRSEIEDLVGFFVNTLVLRTQVDLTLDFKTLLQQIRRHTLDAYAHQDVPFEQLVEALRPERHASYTPLFQVLLVLQNTPMTKLSLPGLQLELVPSESVTTHFDLALNLTDEGKDGLQGCFEYSTDLFDASTVARIAEHFTHLLQAIVAQPESPVGELAMLGEAERQQLLATFNDTATVYPNVQPDTATLHQLFEVQAARSPDHVAVIYEGVSLSYAQLNTQANRLARHLRSLGVGPDTLVGLCVERSLAMIVALYAILKAGGAYVPLDPTYPPERLATILADAQPVVVLAQAHLRDTVVALHGVPVFCLDSDTAILSTYAHDNLANHTQPTHLAYVIYTSGSTGKPKGVGIEHQGIVNRLQWMQQAYPLTASDRILQKTPFSFDVSVWEFFWPLLEGATLVVAKPGGHQDVTYLATLIDAQGITTAHFVPPMLEVFLNESAADCGGSLRQVMCSGQALPLELQERFFAKWDHVALHNLYGPTEASVDVTSWECRKDSTLSCVPIGRPIANIQIHILDGSLNPVPVGVIGHLYIAGIGLARGYLNRPELTAQTFIPNPFSAEPGARMYLSGDLARYLPDGTIEYLGRSDHQVKIRGLRIELGEIESTLATLEAVRDVVVLAREDSAGDQRLVAYLVAYEGQAMPDVAQLRTILLRTLPEYMVPGYFITLDQLPLTSNGKVDRKALPAPDLAQSDVAYVAPRTPTEEIMAEIWADVLQTGRVGVQDEFFALGGHSMLAVQLVSQLRKRAAIEIQLRNLFSHPTLGALAAFVDSSKTVSRHPNLVPIRPQGHLAPLFLIHPVGGEVQYAFDLARHLDADQPVYALAASGLVVGETPRASITEMAAVYLEAIREVQSAGPYTVAGWSLGGMIAYEIARQLVEAGETVNFVGMIDTGSSQFLRTQWHAKNVADFDECRTFLNWIIDQHQGAFDARQHPAYGELTALAQSRDIDAMLTVCQREALLPAHLDMAFVKQIFAVHLGGAKAAIEYETPLVPVTVILLTADHHGVEDATLGWSDVLGQHLHVTRIGGSHMSIVKSPHIEKLAHEISNRIKRYSARIELSYVD